MHPPFFQHRDGPSALLETEDPVERDVLFQPTKTPYDPRLMLSGRYNPENFEEWQGGFFDKDSWNEIMAPWAQTVICGRARLGGIPVGVICTETRTIEMTVPADPANLESQVKVFLTFFYYLKFFSYNYQTIYKKICYIFFSTNKIHIII